MSLRSCNLTSIEDPNTFKGLIDMITVVPRETDNEKRKFKYTNKVSFTSFASPKHEFKVYIKSYV